MVYGWWGLCVGEELCTTLRLFATTPSQQKGICGTKKRGERMEKDQEGDYGQTTGEDDVNERKKEKEKEGWTDWLEDDVVFERRIEEEKEKAVQRRQRMSRVSERDVKNSWKVGRLEERPGSVGSDALFGLVEAAAVPETPLPPQTPDTTRGGDSDPGVG